MLLLARQIKIFPGIVRKLYIVVYIFTFIFKNESECLYKASE